MKILHISTDYCGTEVYPNIVQNLAAKGIEQVVYVPMRNISEDGRNKVDGIEYVYSYVLRIWMKIFYFAKIKKMSQDIFAKVDLSQVDLIHTHFLFTDGGTAYLLKKMYGKKYITTIRNTDVNIYFKYFLHARKFGIEVMSNSEAILFLSYAYRDHVFETYVPAELRAELLKKTQVIPNGINKFWLDNKIGEPKSRDHVVKFIFVGQLSKNKNIHKIIKILKKFNTTIPCNLSIIGKHGDYTDQILELVQENHTIVTYLGEIQDKNILLNHLRNSSIFIMPSKYETFGLVYIEAMTQGIPCLYSKGQGIDGYFKEGEIGYPIDPDDIQDSINRILKILEDYEEISKKCLKGVSHFNWPDITERYISIYANKMNDRYKMCSKTVMDTIGNPDIKFDSKGICQYVAEYDRLCDVRVPDENKRKDKLDKILGAIKAAGEGNDYDCIIGVSGGVDSTYLAYLVKELGLRPLAIHLDNGWNSELAVSNIETILNKLDVNLYTHVLDWEEFKDLQLSFLKASVPDGEIPTDHAITAILYKMAAKHNIKYIISGTNVRTEGIMPTIWSNGHLDWKYIQTIQATFGNKKLKSYPHLSLFSYFSFLLFKRIKKVSILDYIDYDKSKVVAFLENELGWRNYGGKHYESIYTRFFQGYILVKKFSIDKRKGHLSTLICSGLMSKEEALKEIQREPYPSQELLMIDKEFALKKLGLSNEEFQNIMELPKKYYTDYNNNNFIINKLWRLYDYFRKAETRK
jgi:N-acetyl sugar amidotransferase